PASQFQLNILMAVAEFERETIRQRVNSGLPAARARCVRLGRPSSLQKHLPKVRMLLQLDLSISAAARELCLAYSSAHKLARMCNGEDHLVLIAAMVVFLSSSRRTSVQLK